MPKPSLHTLSEILGFECYALGGPAAKSGLEAFAKVVGTPGYINTEYWRLLHIKRLDQITNWFSESLLQSKSERLIATSMALLYALLTIAFLTSTSRNGDGAMFYATHPWYQSLGMLLLAALVASAFWAPVEGCVVMLYAKKGACEAAVIGDALRTLRKREAGKLLARYAPGTQAANYLKEVHTNRPLLEQDANCANQISKDERAGGRPINVFST